MERDRVHILDILDAANLALSYVENIGIDIFLGDLQRQDAVIRRLEIIGEAAKRVTYETKEAYSDIPWGEMVGMRNFMIHEYDSVDMGIIWDTVQCDLPRLIALLEPIVMHDE